MKSPKQLEHEHRRRDAKLAGASPKRELKNGGK